MKTIECIWYVGINNNEHIELGHWGSIDRLDHLSLTSRSNVRIVLQMKRQVSVPGCCDASILTSRTQQPNP